jgi:hypothetical protein
MITLYHGYLSQSRAFQSTRDNLGRGQGYYEFTPTKEGMDEASQLLQRKALTYPAFIIGPLDEAKSCDPLLKCLETYSSRFSGALYANHLGYVPKTITSRCDHVVYCDGSDITNNPAHDLALSIYKKPASVIKEALSGKKRKAMRSLFVALIDVASNEGDYDRVIKMSRYLKQDEIHPFQVFRLAQ